jgi:hypothetical protein
MKHAGADALDRLEPLLARLRAYPQLREKSRGVFYLRSKAFLHFHEDPAGQFADIRAPGGTDFDRLPINEASERRTLLERVARALA